ncbi:MAG: hypothetical protein NVS3B10_12310 [Polyangiales bacterium]
MTIPPEAFVDLASLGAVTIRVTQDDLNVVTAGGWRVFVHVTATPAGTSAYTMNQP